MMPRRYKGGQRAGKHDMNLSFTRPTVRLVVVSIVFGLMPETNSE